jgi:TolB-like protein/tRNA A-37 threonylcarbamoyl transferase component Bud32/Tfp pilus assembly protein PilF
MPITRDCPVCHTSLPDEALFCLHCGTATPTEPGVPPRTAPTGTFEVGKVRQALADRYRVERIVGEGGMATVYLAEDLKHHRKVALKVMRPELAATLGSDRFLREVEIAAQLSHPHILPMYDSGTADGLLYYVMPYVEGESLHGRLKREGQLPVDEALRLAREVAEALAYAHSHGIIHRDIKPANILLSAGHALVADFGIARAVGSGGEALTRTGLAIGTPQYMSPEQATGSSSVDSRTDVYAVGSILYEMLAGEAPFSGPNPQAIIARSLTEVPRPLTAIRAAISPQIEAVIAKTLAKNAADRYATAGELAQAITGATEAVRSGARAAMEEPDTGPSPVLVWGLFGMAAAAALAIMLILVGRLGLPVWSIALAVALLTIGAFVLAATQRAERRRRSGEASTGFARLLTWRNATIGGVLALGLWAVLATTLATRGAGSAAGGDGIRLAILPFENRGAPDDAYLADGIADEVRGKLTGLPGFQVTARTSSDQYRQTTKSLQDIGRELKVDYLLTATVRWARSGETGGRLQVIPELVAARTGTATWQQRFDADVTDVFQVQSAIASRVAAALGVALGSTEEQELARRPTENLAAWDLYLKGRALISNDPATLKQKAGYMEQAAALDPKFTEAWAELSSALSTLYFNGTPDPTVAARAREAGASALATDPDNAMSHAAMATYYQSVLKDAVRAEEEIQLALRAAPNHPEILLRAARVESSLGRWDEALVKLERAWRLDPRSTITAGSLRRVLALQRRYAEALAVGNDALALAPADPGNIQAQAMIHLAQGDLAAARAVIKAAPGSLGQPALVAYLATYNDLFWVLDEAQQDVLLRLPPSAFFDDPAAWGSVFMQTWWLRGEQDKARAYADTARMAFEAQLRGAPDDAQLHVLYGLALAYLGQKEQAIREGEKGVALLPISKDAANGAYYQHQLVRIYLMVGENEKAMDQLEPLLRMPYFLSPGWLRIDPTFEPLRGHPRFEALLKD